LDIRIILIVALLLVFSFLEYIKQRTMFYKIKIPKMNSDERKKKYGIVISLGLEIPLQTSRKYKVKLRPFKMPYSVTFGQALQFIKDGGCTMAMPPEVVEFLVETRHQGNSKVLYYIQNSNVLSFRFISERIFISQENKIPKGAIILGIK